MPDHVESILIVEDSDFNAQVLSKAVSKLVPVTIAKSGAEALDLVAERNFDVVLLDIMLPDIDGFEVCRKIFEMKGPATPSIIFVTSKDDVEDEEKGLSLGAVDYIYKPIVSTIVQARINNHLQLSRARRELVAANMHLTRLAATDPLTGINNRRHFFELMENERARAERYEQDHALMALDLDHFKSINDSHGHDRGDAVLKAVADVWTKALRSHDILGRIGGEEFSAFLPHTNKSQAEATANRMLEAMRQLEIADGKGGVFGVTASIGIAIPGKNCRKSPNICADRALYKAKDGGRDRVVSCSWAAECAESSK